LARAEDGGARGDAILAVLVLEAIIVVALDVLEKFRALRRRHRVVVLVIGPDERRHDDVARGEGHLRRYQQISADICRYLRRYLVTPAYIRSRREDILHRNQYKS